MDVIYSNAKPQFQEFGPFVYKEADSYTDLQSSSLDFEGEYLPGVNATFQQSVTFDSDASGNIDTKMYLTNQALFGAWQSLNEPN